MPRYKPLSVGVVLLGLVPASQHQPDLFVADNQGHQTTFAAGRSHQPALRALHHRLRPFSVRGAGVQGPRGFPKGAGELGVLGPCPTPLLAFAPSRAQHEPDEAEHAVEQIIHLFRPLQLLLRRFEMANLQIVADSG